MATEYRRTHDSGRPFTFVEGVHYRWPALDREGFYNEDPACPACNHNNALIYTVGYETKERGCRDCLRSFLPEPDLA